MKRKAVSILTISERIQQLRKNKGMSQEELADKVGVSRQAVSKWESNQSLPDIEKIILLSNYFDVTTDYLLKGTEPTLNITKSKIDSRIFLTIGSAFNLIGFILSIIIWKEQQTPISVAIGLVIMTLGCMIFILGQLIDKNENKKISIYYFLGINIWFLSLIPISCIFNCAQGTLGGYWWTFSPIPQLGNSISAYIICWLLYFAICCFTDILIIKHLRR